MSVRKPPPRAPDDVIENADFMAAYLAAGGWSVTLHQPGSASAAGCGDSCSPTETGAACRASTELLIGISWELHLKGESLWNGWEPADDGDDLQLDVMHGRSSGAGLRPILGFSGPPLTR